MSGNRAVSLTAHLFVRDAAQAVVFYRAAFGAAEIFRQTADDGHIGFSELAIGHCRLLLSDETPDLGALAPETVGGSPVLLTLAVTNPDLAVERAVEHGAVVEMPVDDSFWGERYGVVRDPMGHRWAITTEREELSPDEMSAGIRGYLDQWDSS